MSNNSNKLVSLISIDSVEDPFVGGKVRNRISFSKKVNFKKNPKLLELINALREQLAPEANLAKPETVPLSKVGNQAWVVEIEGDEENGYSTNTLGLRYVDSRSSPYTWKKVNARGFGLDQKNKSKLQKYNAG